MLDLNGLSSGESIPMDLLVDYMPYWMYPFLHLLSDGSLFIFAAKSSQIFDPWSNTTIAHMPEMPGMYRTYPNTGTA